MVRIEEFDNDPVKMYDRTRKLEKIAKEIFGEKFHIGGVSDYIWLISNARASDSEVSMIIGLDYRNIIYVNKGAFLKDAIKLAKAYEMNGELEFTVKKNYRKK